VRTKLACYIALSLTSHIYRHFKANTTQICKTKYLLHRTQSSHAFGFGGHQLEILLLSKVRWQLKLRMLKSRSHLLKTSLPPENIIEMSIYHFQLQAAKRHMSEQLVNKLLPGMAASVHRSFYCKSLTASQ
jgi:hypothetical protein